MRRALRSDSSTRRRSGRRGANTAVMRADTAMKMRADRRSAAPHGCRRRIVEQSKVVEAAIKQEGGRDAGYGPHRRNP